MNLKEERKRLLGKCEQILTDRISSATREIDSYTAQSNEETKSSAGDKYETARAMIHLEKEKVASQLNESLKLKRVLNQIRNQSTSSGLGRLVMTDNGNFFVAVSLGKVTLGEEEYFVISPVAPLGKSLAQARVGEEISFNQKRYLVKELVT